MSNEVKVALLAIVAVALFYWGYKFVRGKNVLATSNIYYVAYDNVDQLNMSAPVLINGFQVGFVADIYLNPENYEQVIVKLDLDKSISIPKSTQAIIKDTGFMGGKAIVLKYDAPCTGENCAEPGSYLQPGRMSLLNSMVAEDELKDYMDIVKEGLKDVIDTLNRQLLSDEAEGPLAESVRDLSTTLENLKSTTGQLNSLLASSSGNIDASLANLRSITGTIQANEENIDKLIGNTSRLTTDLAEADLKQTLQEADQAITQLKSTLETADNALNGVTAVVNKVNNGEGTLGKLLSDEQLYQRLNSLSRETDALIEDFQERPYRYMPFKSRSKVKKFDRKDEKLETAEERANSGN